MPAPRLVLALDSGSPVVSVAVADQGRVLAETSLELGQSSGAILRLVSATLDAAGVEMRQLDGLVGLRGPGSFTGLRVGLATLQGLHEALQVPATAISTFEALAELAPKEGSEVLTVVDALRDEWFVQPFMAESQARSLASPRCVSRVELVSRQPAQLIGFGAARLAASFERPPRAIEPGALAGAALRSATARPPSWNHTLLTAPLYLRRPSVTLPGC